MAESTIWWLLAGGAIVAELLTGTFYLLMLALGFAAAALAAYAGSSMVVQTLIASAVGGGAVVLWNRIRSKRPRSLPASANPDVNLDIGETVQVEAWRPDGTAQVNYRGANWTVLHRPGNPPSPGPHRVVEVTGNRLLVEKL
ncbi:NfeD family protein [Rhodoferax sp. WC2427]|uniref:NfeD family protein n=1 Tax=Rhodoferax sp. WC2427 TaxID=3234144 RepID=UPI003465CF40